VPLFVVNENYAISNRFSWNFSPFWPSDGVWALNVKQK
jgi:hypothetical protein